MLGAHLAAVTAPLATSREVGRLPDDCARFECIATVETGANPSLHNEPIAALADILKRLCRDVFLPSIGDDDTDRQWRMELNLIRLGAQFYIQSGCRTLFLNLRQSAAKVRRFGGLGFAALWPLCCLGKRWRAA